MNQEAITKNLIMLRRQNNLTQKELSLKLNYSDKVISKWERGESLPDIIALDSIAKFYGVKVDDLISTKNIEGNEVNQEVIVKEVIKPSKLLIWSVPILMLFLISVPFWTNPLVFVLIDFGILLYFIIISFPISHWEWEANYQDSKIYVKNTVSRTQLYVNGKLVDEVTKLISSGVRLSSKINDVSIKVNVNNIFIPKCNIIID